MSLVAETLRRRRAALTVTYVVIVIENVFELLYPFAIGLAITGLLEDDWGGVVAFVALSLLHTAVGVSRQVWDTRSFHRLHVDLVAGLVERQRSEGVPTSAVAGRAQLAGEYVVFLESDVGTSITAAFAVVGSLVMLTIFDVQLGLVGLALGIPVALVNTWLVRRSRRIHRAINDETEGQVAVIETGDREAIRTHFRLLALHGNRLSDTEATSWGVVEVLSVGFSVFALWSAIDRGADAGAIFATVAYAWAYVGGFDAVPTVLQRLSSLGDIRRRLDAVAGDRAGSG